MRPSRTICRRGRWRICHRRLCPIRRHGLRIDFDANPASTTRRSQPHTRALSGFPERLDRPDRAIGHEAPVPTRPYASTGRRPLPRPAHRSSISIMAPAARRGPTRSHRSGRADHDRMVNWPTEAGRIAARLLEKGAGPGGRRPARAASTPSPPFSERPARRGGLRSARPGRAPGQDRHHPARCGPSLLITLNAMRVRPCHEAGRKSCCSTGRNPVHERSPGRRTTGGPGLCHLHLRLDRPPKGS